MALAVENMDPRLQHLRYFLALADERSFTRAANRVGITQPSLSGAIREFELSLQISLFTRSSRFVEVSEDGATLLQAAQDAVDAIDRFRLQANELGRKSACQQLRIGAPLYSASPSLEFEIIERFSEAYPSSSPTVVRRTVSDLIDLLKNGSIDLALILGPHSDSALSFCQIVTLPFVLAVWSGSPYAQANPLPLKALSGLHIAGFDREGSPAIYDVLMGPLTNAGALVESVLENSIFGMRRHCETHGGGMVIPEEWVPTVTAEGQFVCLSVTDLQLTLDLRLARTNGPQSRAAQRFWDFVQKDFIAPKILSSTEYSGLAKP